jgi:hypothetical protein
MTDYVFPEGVVQPEFDPVERPEHYNSGGQIECIQYIADFLSYEEYVGYLRGNIAKYLHRWRYKNGLEDLNKARWYLDRLIEAVEYTDAMENPNVHA